ESLGVNGLVLLENANSTTGSVRSIPRRENLVDLRFDFRRQSNSPEWEKQKAKRQRGTHSDNLILGIESRSFEWVGWRCAHHRKSVCSFTSRLTPQARALIGESFIGSLHHYHEFFSLSRAIWPNPFPCVCQPSIPKSHS